MSDIAELSETIQKETIRIADVLLQNSESMESTKLQGEFSLDKILVGKISDSMSKVLTAFSESTLKAIGNYTIQVVKNANTILTKMVETPFLNWASNYGFSPLYRALEEISVSSKLTDWYNKLNKAYLQAMYECHWFPYVGNSVTCELFAEVTEILATSKGASKRREKRIDKAILNYYGKNEIIAIKKQWKQSDLESHIIRILTQALDAHLRGEYALTIACLLTMWEGLIHKRTFIDGRRNSEKTKNDFKQLISKNEYEPIFADFYENFIVSQCNTPEEVIEGIPNRNGVSHSKYKKYPNKKAALNAILLTDFIIGLTPKDIDE